MFPCLSRRSPILNSASISPCTSACEKKRDSLLSALIPMKISNTTRRRCSPRSAWGCSQSAEVLARRGYEKLPLKRYNYGVRICPEPVNWGGLSGSTYTEAVSWGKFVPPEEGGRFAEVLEDATVALPLVVGAVLERLKYFKR